MILGFLVIIIFLLFVLCWKITYWLFKLAFGLAIMLLILIMLSMTVEAYEYSPTEIVDIGKIVQHECPHESEYGQRLVIDTILNRVESPEFPNTVKEVLNQPGQYCNPSRYPDKGIYKLVAEEIYTRTNDRVLWYRTGRYHTYGEPIMQEGSHYFTGR